MLFIRQVAKHQGQCHTTCLLNKSWPNYLSQWNSLWAGMHSPDFVPVFESKWLRQFNTPFQHPHPRSPSIVWNQPRMERYACEHNWLNKEYGRHDHRSCSVASVTLNHKVQLDCNGNTILSVSPPNSIISDGWSNLLTTLIKSIDTFLSLILLRK